MGMWSAKVIKNKIEHENALASLMALMVKEPTKGTEEADQLELLSVLIDQYESKNFPVDLPDPIDAIKFRMQQQQLKKQDLVEYIGSASKVSEVLNRKRPLSIAMIRRLHKGLGIPASVLIGESDAEIPDDSGVEYTKFPLKEMFENNYFPEFKGSFAELKECAEELVKPFMNSVTASASPLILCRSSAHQRSGKPMNTMALTAWQVRILQRAQQKPLCTVYKQKTVDLSFMQQLVRFSWSDTGPVVAQEYLSKHGIYLLIEPHLQKTYLDGAALLNHDGAPVIGMTLRHDKLDNFWFTLMHELAHVALHLNEKNPCFFDDLDPNSQGDDMENEADAMAYEALLPKDIWVSSNAYNTHAKSDVLNLAKELSIHPAIVAGRIRYEHKNYKSYRDFMGQNLVRKLFH